MKILILSNVPPCDNHSTGRFLSYFLEKFSLDSLACYAILDPQFKPNLNSKFQSMKMRYQPKPRERGLRLLPSKLGLITAFLVELYMAFIKVPRIMKDLKAFIEEVKPTHIWCLLEGQTLIRLAKKLSEQIEIPLYVHVLEPENWWLRTNGVDFLSRKLIQKSFTSVMMQSKAIATNSFLMAEDYQKRFNIKITPIIKGIPSIRAIPPTNEKNDTDTITIALAGKHYWDVGWQSLLAMLEKANWKIASKKIIVKVFGEYISAYANTALHIEFLGSEPVTSIIESFRTADILYFPFWFKPFDEEKGRYHFPSKLFYYLAASKPILFHGLRTSAVSKFLEDNQAAMFCNEISQPLLHQCIEKMILDKDLCERLTKNGYQTFLEHLTEDKLKMDFMQFLDFHSIKKEVGIKNEVLEF